MHAESIQGWNNYLYKNVKQNKKEIVDRETEESRMVNVAGFVEMLLDIEQSPYYFMYKNGELWIVDYRDKKLKSYAATSFSGRSMVKNWLKDSFDKKYKKYERSSDDQYANGVNTQSSGASMPSSSSANSPLQHASFQNLQYSIFHSFDNLDFNMKYQPAYVY